MDKQGFVKIAKLVTFNSLKKKKCGTKELIEVSRFLKKHIKRI